MTKEKYVFIILLLNFYFKSYLYFILICTTKILQIKISLIYIIKKITIFKRHNNYLINFNLFKKNIYFEIRTSPHLKKSIKKNNYTVNN